MFDLMGAIRGYLATHTQRAPEQIAPVIRRMIPRTERTDVLDELIADAVRDAERHLKQDAIKNANGAKPPKPARSGSGRVAGTYKQQKQKFRAYDDLMKMIVAVPYRFRKPFADCNRLEVIALQEMHSTLGDTNYTRANQYGNVVDLFAADDDDTLVADLKDTDVVKAMQ